MSSLVRWQRLAQPRHAQTRSLCLSAEWESSLRASCQLWLQQNKFTVWWQQLCFMVGERVHAREICFFFYMRMPSNLFQNVNFSKTMQNRFSKGIREPKSHLNQRRRKLVSTWQQRYSFLFFLPHCLSCLSALPLCCPSEVQGKNAATTKCASHWSRSGNRAALIMNLIIPRPKWRSCASELIRQGIARPKQPQTTSTEEWVRSSGSKGAVSGGKRKAMHDILSLINPSEGCVCGAVGAGASRRGELFIII